MPATMSDKFNTTIQSLEDGKPGQKSISGFLILCSEGDYLDVDGDEATLEPEYTAVYDSAEEAGAVEIEDQDENTITVSESEEHSIVPLNITISIGEPGKTGGTVLTEAYKTASKA
jgi:hypothetical protein